MIEYTIKRSKRKTIGIYVTESGVEVRAPTKCSKARIEDFLLRKQEWIIESLDTIHTRKQNKESFCLNYGDKILYRGELYPIVKKDIDHAIFDQTSFYLPPNLDPNKIKATCVELYKQLAFIHLSKRAQFFAKQMGVEPTAIKISNAKRNWGSCSTKKSINFAWRLIMATDEVIDYVVVHELAHIAHMNHSKKFWELVQSVMPEYKQYHEQLKKLDKKLANEDWG